MNRYQHLSKSECKAELARVTAEATDLLRQAMREDPFETVMYMLDYAAEYDERNPGSTAAILPNFLVDSSRVSLASSASTSAKRVFRFAFWRSRFSVPISRKSTGFTLSGVRSWRNRAGSLGSLEYPAGRGSVCTEVWWHLGGRPRTY